MLSNVFRYGVILLLGVFATAANHVFASSDNYIYAGPRVGLMATSPGTYDDNAAIGVIAGYQFEKNFWAIEAELNSTVTRNDWSGRSFGVFGVYRVGRIGTDTFIFFPKVKIGVIQSRFKIDDMRSEDKTGLGVGVGLAIGDKNYIVEMEFSGSVSKSLGSDEVAFFSVNILYPF